MGRIHAAEKWVHYYQGRIDEFEGIRQERGLTYSQERRLATARQRLREKTVEIERLQNDLHRPPLSARGHVRSVGSRTKQPKVIIRRKQRAEGESHEKELDA